MITVTPNAIKHLQDLLRDRETAGTAGLRLAVEKGGCAGFQYTMKVDEPHDLDEVYEQGGVRVIVDPESLPFLSNSSIDYVDSLNDSGFRVENPHAARSCGCGTSFEPKE